MSSSQSTSATHSFRNSSAIVETFRTAQLPEQSNIATKFHENLLKYKSIRTLQRAVIEGQQREKKLQKNIRYEEKAQLNSDKKRVAARLFLTRLQIYCLQKNISQQQLQNRKSIDTISCKNSQRIATDNALLARISFKKLANNVLVQQKKRRLRKKYWFFYREKYLRKSFLKLRHWVQKKKENVQILMRFCALAESIELRQHALKVQAYHLLKIRAQQVANKKKLTTVLEQDKSARNLVGQEKINPNRSLSVRRKGRSVNNSFEVVPTTVYREVEKENVMPNLLVGKQLIALHDNILAKREVDNIKQLEVQNALRAIKNQSRYAKQDGRKKREPVRVTHNQSFDWLKRDFRTIDFEEKSSFLANAGAIKVAERSCISSSSSSSSSSSMVTEEVALKKCQKIQEQKMLQEQPQRDISVTVSHKRQNNSIHTDEDSFMKLIQTPMPENSRKRAGQIRRSNSVQKRVEQVSRVEEQHQKMVTEINQNTCFESNEDVVLLRDKIMQLESYVVRMTEELTTEKNRQKMLMQARNSKIQRLY